MGPDARARERIESREERAPKTENLMRAAQEWKKKKEEDRTREERNKKQRQRVEGGFALSLMADSPKLRRVHLLVAPPRSQTDSLFPILNEMDAFTLCSFCVNSALTLCLLCVNFSGNFAETSTCTCDLSFCLWLASVHLRFFVSLSFVPV